MAFALEQSAGAAKIALGTTLVVAIAASPGTGVAAAAAWAGALMGMLMLHSRMLRRAAERLDAPGGMRPARQILTGSSLVLALILGLLPALSFPGMEVDLRLLLTLFFCCWVAAAMSSLGVTPALYGSYLAIVLGGMVVGWLRAGGGVEGVYISLALVFYGLVLRAFSRNFARRIEEGIAIRAENADLVRQLSIANEAKTRFIMAASHDLRQPLHAISYLGGVLARARTPEDVRQASDALGTAVESLTKLFSAILDLSRIESGAVQATLAPFQVDALIARLDTEYRALCVAGGRRWECLVESATALSDPALLERILRNLLDNALKHGGPDGTVRLAVWMRDEVVITVSDTGPGIPPHERQRVFEEFYRVKDGGGQPGLGLGLSIVRRLAERLGCKIEIGYTDAAAHRGTAITVRVPSGSVAAPSQAATAKDDAGGEEDVAGLAVLVIDDDAMVLNATRVLLAQWRCQVAVCRDPQELDAVLATFGAPDVALVDYHLGDGPHGLDVVARVRTRFPAMGVVMVTGESDEKVLAQLAEAGLPVLEKPVSPRELRLTLSLFKAAGE